MLETITRDGTAQIRKNFNEQELLSGSVKKGYSDAPTAHTIATKLLDALQYIRDYYGTPITVNSTYRSKKHNDALGSGDWSMHRTDDAAIDFSFSDMTTHDRFVDEIRSGSGLFYDLREKFGVSIGVYKNFCHIDIGQGAGVKSKHVHTDQFGTFGLWDNSGKLGKDFAPSLEDSKANYKPHMAGGNMFLLAFLIYLAWRNRKKLKALLRV